MTIRKPHGFTLAELLITLTSFLILAAFVTLVIVGVKGCNYIGQKGVKGTAERVWNGAK